MANWYGSARSNYFRVKDKDAFTTWCASRNLNILNSTGESTVAIAPSDFDDGAWPSQTFNEETQDYDDVDLVAELATHLAEGEVAVLMQIGAEKLRYLTGWAVAVNHKGETVSLNLSDIYDLAKTKFGVTPTEAQY